MNTPTQNTELDTLVKHYGIKAVVAKINCNALDVQSMNKAEATEYHQPASAA